MFTLVSVLISVTRLTSVNSKVRNYERTFFFNGKTKSLKLDSATISWMIKTKKNKKNVQCSALRSSLTTTQSSNKLEKVSAKKNYMIISR